MLSLFRLIDINIGSIVLDGVDTASIALDSLRKQLAIIPQVSVFVSVTASSAVKAVQLACRSQRLKGSSEWLEKH
jgi:ABC-type multidrug transport system fused ATPase/permease subunit